MQLKKKGRGKEEGSWGGWAGWGGSRRGGSARSDF